MINDNSPDEPEEEVEEIESKSEEVPLIPLAVGEDQNNRKLTVLRYTPYEIIIITNW